MVVNQQSPRRGKLRVLSADCLSRKPKYVPGSQRNPRFRGLHQALARAIPALGPGGRLSSEEMEASFQQALRASDPDTFKDLYLEANLMKRYTGADLSSSEDRIRAALLKLEESEVKCAYTNRVFAAGLDWSNACVPLDIRRTLLRARRILSTVLGPFPWEMFPRACGFTPGATTEFSRKEATLHNKWDRASHVTAAALPYAVAVCKWAGLNGQSWSSSARADWDLFPELLPGDLLNPEFRIVTANSVFTVPKNFERDRTACKPVTWNGFLQKGVGKLIRRRLQRARLLLLPDAQEYHGVLAKLASRTGWLATRDLASASDCWCTELVRCLLPPDWCQVIFDLREEEGLLPSGETVRWEKISTMGNGFTFELQTALFAALVEAVCDKGSLVSVYGDDILFPTRFVDKVDELLTFCGFTINTDKSFHTGKFRESCGAHYYDGRNVKPFYLTDLPRTIGDVINLHNDIVRWCQGRPTERWAPVWRACREIVPREYWGPAPHQGVLWAEWDESVPQYVPEYQAFAVGMVAREAVEAEVLFDSVGALLQKLWMVDDLPWDSSRTSTYRKTTDREVRAWLLCDRTQWNRLTAETLCT